MKGAGISNTVGRRPWRGLRGGRTRR